MCVSSCLYIQSRTYTPQQDPIPFGSDLVEHRKFDNVNECIHVILFDTSTSSLRILVEKRGHSFSLNGKFGFPSGQGLSVEEICMKRLDAEILDATLYAESFTGQTSLVRHRYYLVRTAREVYPHDGQTLVWKNESELRDSMTHFLQVDKAVVSLILDRWHEHEDFKRKKRRKKMRRKKEMSPGKRKRRAERVRKIGASFLSHLTRFERRRMK